MTDMVLEFGFIYLDTKGREITILQRKDDNIVFGCHEIYYPKTEFHEYDNKGKCVSDKGYDLTKVRIYPTDFKKRIPFSFPRGKPYKFNPLEKEHIEYVISLWWRFPEIYKNSHVVLTRMICDTVIGNFEDSWNPETRSGLFEEEDEPEGIDNNET